MGAAKHVGRVGALAVALGIGSAVAAAPAWAEPSETSSTPSSATSDNAPSPADSPIGAGTPTDDTSSTVTATPPKLITEPLVNSDAGQSVLDPHGDQERPKSRVQKRKAPREWSAAASGIEEDRTGSAISLPRAGVLERRSAPQSPAPEVTPAAVSIPVAAQTVLHQSDPVPEVAASTGRDAAPAVEIATVGPSAAPGSGVPVQTPAEWALLAAVRREIATGTTDTTEVAAPPLASNILAFGDRLLPTAAPAESFSAAEAAVSGVSIQVGNGPSVVAVSPDGSRVYVTNAHSNTVSVINTAVNTVVGTIRVGTYPTGVAVSPDGSRVYVTNFYGSTVSVINTATNTVVGTIGVQIYPTGVAVSPDGSRVYVASAGQSYANGAVSVIGTATNTVVGTIRVGTFPFAVAVNPDGSRVYVTNTNDKTVSVISTATNTVVGTVGVGFPPNGVAVSPDGKRVYVALNVGMAVIDTATSTMVGSHISVEGDPQSVAVSPDGKRVYLALLSYGEVAVIDAATNALVGTPISVGSYAHWVAMSPDGGTAYVTNFVDGTLVVIDTGYVGSTPGSGSGNGGTGVGGLQRLGIALWQGVLDVGRSISTTVNNAGKAAIEIVKLIPDAVEIGLKQVQREGQKRLDDLNRIAKSAGGGLAKAADNAAKAVASVAQKVATAVKVVVKVNPVVALGTWLWDQFGDPPKAG